MRVTIPQIAAKEERDYLRVGPALYRVLGQLAAGAVLEDAVADHKLRLVEDVRLLRVRPGDTVVLSTTAHLRQEDADYFAGQMRRLVPEGVRVVVLGDGARMEVLRHEG